MPRIVFVARIVLGSILLAFGLNYFVHFLPEMDMSEQGIGFLIALLETGYVFPVIKTVEIVAGVLLIAGAFVPLALTLVAPVIVNIALYHLYLDSNGWWIAATVTLLEVFLAVAYRDAFKGLFQVRTSPSALWQDQPAVRRPPAKELVEDPIRS